MKVVEKLAAKANDVWNQPGVTIAFLGDSVTQGCFEIYRRADGNMETVFEQQAGYHHKVAQILGLLYPAVPVQIINGGLSGDNAVHAYQRIDRDVIRYQPDLAVVCFGLNDAMQGLSYLPRYLEALEEIFLKLKEQGIEVIFMTPNMMNTKCSCHLEADWVREYAAATGKIQNDGVLDTYMEAAKEICAKHGIAVCDVYAKWKRLHACGVDTTELLANKTNHPARQMHWLFAYALVETMMSGGEHE